MPNHHLTHQHPSSLLPLPTFPFPKPLPPPRPIEMIQLRLHLPLPPQHPPPKPPRKLLRPLELCVRARRHAENVVQLFERALFGLVQEEEDEEEGDDVEAGVEAEDACRCEGGEHAGEGDGEDGAPEIWWEGELVGWGEVRGGEGMGRWRTICGYGPGHADFAVAEGEDFCAVGEGHGAFSWGVEGGEDEDE